MKRAAMVLVVVTALVVLVPPSAFLPDVSSCYATPKPTGGDGGGGTDQGDADGLSGMGNGGSGKLTVEQGMAPVQSVDYVMILVGTWWKFMIWMR